MCEKIGEIDVEQLVKEEIESNTKKFAGETVGKANLINKTLTVKCPDCGHVMHFQLVINGKHIFLFDKDSEIRTPFSIKCSGCGLIVVITGIKFRHNF